MNESLEEARRYVRRKRIFQRYEVSRCSEDPSQQVVRIERDSEEGHMSGFRQSPEFRMFFEAVGPFVHDIDEMRHYEVMLASER